MIGHVAPSVVTRTQPRCGLVGAVGWAVAAVQLLLFLVLRPAFPHNEGRRLTLPAAASRATKRIYIIRHGEKAEPADRSDYDYDHGCLSEKGWARAYNLKSIFGKGGWLHTPDALFSANYHEPLECRDANGWYRTQQTLAALAQAAPGGLGLTVGNSSGWMPQLCGAEVQPDASFARAVPGHLVSRQGRCAPYGLCGGDSWAEGRRCDDRFAGECCNRAAAESLLAKLSESGVSTVLVAWESVNTVWLTRALGVPEDQVRDWDFTEAEYDRIYALHFDEKLRLLLFEDGLRQGFDELGSSPQPDSLRWQGPQNGCGRVHESYPAAESWREAMPVSEEAPADGVIR